MPILPAPTLPDTVALPGLPEGVSLPQIPAGIPPDAGGDGTAPANPLEGLMDQLGLGGVANEITSGQGAARGVRRDCAGGGVLFVGARYVRLDNLLGFGQYTVDAQFANSGGVFKNAEVTYRGVPVGRVGELSLTADGINVELKLDNGGPDIPASARAVVANRSAIGEQYVDLRPDTDEGPFLTDGSVIEQDRTAVPIPVEDLLVSTNDLVRSVPVDALHTVITELGDAFDGRGDDLQVLVDSLAELSAAGVDYLPQTVTLVRDSEPVLNTQSVQSSAIQQFSSDLDLVTAQLRESDPDIRRLIETGAGRQRPADPARRGDRSGG